MKNLWICLLALVIAVPTFADEMTEGEKNNEKKQERPNQRKREKKEKPDQRTPMNLPIGRLSEKNQEKVCEALTKMSAIAEATADVKKKTVEVKFNSAASTGIVAIAKALHKSGGYLDLKRFKLKYPCTVKLAGPMSGAEFDRRLGKKRGFKSLAGQRLLQALKAISGVRSAQFTDPSNLKLGMDREVGYSTVSSLIARYGSRSKGSAVIKDVTWIAEKVSPQQGKGKKGKKRKK